MILGLGSQSKRDEEQRQRARDEQKTNTVHLLGNGNDAGRPAPPAAGEHSTFERSVDWSKTHDDEWPRGYLATCNRFAFH